MPKKEDEVMSNNKSLRAVEPSNGEVRPGTKILSRHHLAFLAYTELGLQFQRILPVIYRSRAPQPYIDVYISGLGLDDA
jgi:hypothetical protein